MVESRSTCVALALAVMATAPATTLASWGQKGELEPNTARDVNDHYMWIDADHARGGERVYFNGFLGEARAPHTCVPFVGPCVPCGDDFGLYLYSPCIQDCNADGYIGNGDQGLLEYRSELLPDPSICPPVATPNPVPYDWFPSHNDGSWVRELLPIGWDRQGERRDGNGNSIDLNIYDINDSAARVWADVCAPGAPPHTYCHLDPLPRGTTRSTGGLLRTADCVDDYQATRAADLVLDTAGLHAYSFDDAPTAQDQSASPLNVKNPWGTSADASYASVFDCAAPPAAVIPLVFVTFYVAPPATQPTVTPSGFPAGTVSYFGSQTNECRGPRWLGDEPYALEGPFGNTAFVRQQTDFPMRYVMGLRPEPPFVALGKPYQNDLGTRHVEASGYWTADNALDLASDPFFTRASFQFASPLTLTYSAFVSPSVRAAYGLTLAAGSTTGAYGAEACGTATSGVSNGWACSPAAWWPGGAPTTRSIQAWADVPYAPRVGDPFNVRDVDCYDVSATGAREAGVSYATLTGGSC